MALSTLVVVFLCLAAVAHAGFPVVVPTMPANPFNDPDLPGFVHTNLDVAAGSIIIPFGTFQGRFNGTGVHLFNFPVYGLVAHLLWKDIPLRFALRSGKTFTNQTDFSVASVQAWPPVNATTNNSPVVRDFDGGSYIVPAQFARFAWVHIMDYVNGSARLERAEFCETNITVIFNATQNFQIPLRYNMTTKPFISVMDSSTYAFIQVKYLQWAGFVWGQHYKQMSYDEANSINEATCVSYISEPHFLPGSTAAPSFQAGMRQFVESGGNFIAQCGGVGTYEQCDNDRSRPVNASRCPRGFLATSPGGFRLNPGDPSSERAIRNFAPDTLFAQYLGNWKIMPANIQSLGVWSTVDGSATSNTSLNSANAAHWVVGGPRDSVFGGLTYQAVHAKLSQFHGKVGGNIFYLAGHEYYNFDGISSRERFQTASPAGMRLWLNGALHIANRSGCRATVILPDGTIREIGELTIDPCRYDSSDPSCNTVYDCTAPKFSGYYKEGWNYGVELLAEYPLSFVMNVTLPNRLAILAILDSFNFTRSSTSATTSGTLNTLTGVHRSLPYYFNALSSRWGKVSVAESITTSSTSTPRYYARNMAFTSDRATVASTNAPANQGNSFSRILDALLAGLQDQNLVWDGSLRVIHLYTNSTPGTIPSGLTTALNTLRTPVVIAVPTSSLKTAYDALNLPRTRVVVATFPNYATPLTATEAVVGAAATTLLDPVLTATNALLTTIPLNLLPSSDPLSVASPVFNATLDLNSINPDLQSLQAVANQPLNLALTNGYGMPGGPTFSPFPYTVRYDVGGIDLQLKVAIFWSEFAKALPFSATVNEFTNVTVPIVSRLRLSASTTSNKDIFIEVLNITKNGGTTNVWLEDFELVALSNDEIHVPGKYYRADDFIFKTKFNKFGVYTVNYRVYDRCVRSESTITLTVLDVNTPPVGSNFTYFLIPSDSAEISWTLPLQKLDDVETPFDSLRVSFESVSIANSGVLQIASGNFWTNAQPSTLYPVSTPIRFLSTSLSSINASFPYNVHDTDGARNVVPVFARFEFTEPPNQPPVISVTPSSNPTLTTPQNESATFTVTVTDFLTHVTSKVRVESVSIAEWADLVTLRPSSTIDARAYDTFNAVLSGTELIPSIVLVTTALNNTVTFDFNWKPSFNAPFGATYSFVLYAEDPRGLISNKVTVVLRTPENIAPVVVGFETPGATPSYPEVSTSTQRQLKIASTDANLIHTDKLNLTILSLPIFGTLYQSDCNTLIAANDVLTFAAAPQPADRTVIPVCYVQTPYASGTDSFIVKATDLAGLSSQLRTLTIEIAPVNFPPVSVNVSRTTDGEPITFTIDSSDPDGDMLNFTILSVNVPADKGTLVYNATNIPIAVNQMFEPTQLDSMGWAHKFTYSPLANVVAHVVNFTYRVTDPGGLNSDIYWAIIRLDTDYVPPVPPVSIPGNFTGPEDRAITLNFDPLVFDSDGIVVQIRVETVPTNGTLFGPGNVPLTPGSIFSYVPNSSLVTFAPSPDFWGTVNFTYHVIDSQGLRSNTTDIAINVTSVNDPPLISATPNSVTVERSQIGSFLVNVSDIDSASITLLVAPGNTIPSASSLTSGTWTLNGIDLTEVITLTNSAPGVDMQTRIDWTPFISLPDGSVGSFTVYAVDSDRSQTTARPVLNVRVIDNNPPTIVPTYTYSFDVNEDFAPFNITLAGTDPQTYHREVLDVILRSLPIEGVVLSQESASQVGVVSSTGQNGETTATVTATAQPNYHGSVSFRFEVRDLLGALSAEQVVVLNVLPVNDPPTSADQSLVVLENLCFASAESCPQGFTSLQNLVPVTISGADVDLDPLTLRFTTLPVLGGSLYFFDGSSLTKVESTSTSFSSTSGNSWRFFYEPPLGQHSDCADIKKPSAETCSVFTTATFTISDAFSSTTQTLSLTVLPVNNPPTGENLVFTINEDENLTIVLTAADPDDDVTVLITSTTGISPGSRGSLKTTTGVDVSASEVVATAADKSIVFVPLPDDFSGPNQFYSRFFYKVVDSAGAESPEYSVTIFVLPVADELVVLGDNFIRIDEDTTATFRLGIEGINWVSKDSGEFSITLVGVSEVGNFTYCLNAECEEFNEQSINTTVSRETVFKYVPPPNEFGENFATITYKLVLRPVGITTPTVKTLTFTIHVNPVNDPPVLVPQFPIDPLSTIFDEDTFKVIYFTATDIDTSDEELSASLVHGLQSGVTMKVYNCLSETDESDGCVNGTLLSTSSTELVAIAPARWALGLNPIPNANGKARLTFIVSDGFLESPPVVAPITVRPINDPPKINNATFSAASFVSFAFTGSDIDFNFRTVSFTLTDLSGFGRFDMSAYNLSSTMDESVPCYLPEETKISCTVPIQSIPSWIELVRYHFDGNLTDLKRSIAQESNTTNSTDRQIQIVLDDLGNIDYRPGMNLNDTVVLTVVPPVPESLVARAGTSDNSIAIGAAIGGLLLGAIAAALLIFFMRKKASAGVDGYFARMALEMDGSSNSSPLYQGSAKGGDNALYKGNNIND